MALPTQPAELPRWAVTTGNTESAYITDPPSGNKDNGWVPGYQPPAEWMNWFQYTVYLWVVYLQGFTNNLFSTANAWTDGQSMTGGSGQSAGIIGTGNSSGGIGVVGQGIGVQVGVQGTGGATNAAGLYGQGGGTTGAGLYAAGAAGGNGNGGQFYGTGTADCLVATPVGSGAGVKGNASGSSGGGAGIHGVANEGPAGQFDGGNVRGAILLTPSNTPTTPSEGELYYESGGHVIQYWNGSAWKTITAS